MDIFYAQPDRIGRDEIILDDFESKHILNALRKATGDAVWITDGQGRVYKTLIVRKKPHLTLKIENRSRFARRGPHIILAVGFIRANRLDFLIEKGTELGVTAFHLIRSHYANYHSSNMSRFGKITRQAIKQSRQYYLPEIILHSDFQSFFEQSRSFDIRLAAIDSEQPRLMERLNTVLYEKVKAICLLVGPEGGFSEEEIRTINANGFKGVSLGKSRLRTETAAISGLSVIQQYINS